MACATNRQEHAYNNNMTLSEHIRTVANNIQEQRSQMGVLAQNKAASIVALSVSVTAFVCLFLRSNASTGTLAMVLGLGFFAFWNLVRFSMRLNLLHDLISDNERYRSIIVEEAYTGKDLGPKFD